MYTNNPGFAGIASHRIAPHPVTSGAKIAPDVRSPLKGLRQSKVSTHSVVGSAKHGSEITTAKHRSHSRQPVLPGQVRSYRPPKNEFYTKAEMPTDDRTLNRIEQDLFLARFPYSREVDELPAGWTIADDLA